MADDKPEDAGLAPDTGRAKRTPPTIDLEATEVSTQPQDVAGEPEAQPAAEQAAHDEVKVEEPKYEAKSEAESELKPEPQPEPTPESAEEQPSIAPASASRPVSPWVVAPFSGAAAAAIVIGVGW